MPYAKGGPAAAALELARCARASAACDAADGEDDAAIEGYASAIARLAARLGKVLPMRPY
jgi:hypothetical protein